MVIHAILWTLTLIGLSRIFSLCYDFQLPVSFLDPPVSQLVAGKEQIFLHNDPVINHIQVHDATDVNGHLVNTLENKRVTDRCKPMPILRALIPSITGLLTKLKIAWSPILFIPKKK